MLIPMCKFLFWMLLNLAVPVQATVILLCQTKLQFNEVSLYYLGEVSLFYLGVLFG